MMWDQKCEYRLSKSLMPKKLFKLLQFNSWLDKIVLHLWFRKTHTHIFSTQYSLTTYAGNSRTDITTILCICITRHWQSKQDPSIKGSWQQSLPSKLHSAILVISSHSPSPIQSLYSEGHSGWTFYYSIKIHIQHIPICNTMVLNCRK